MEVKDTKYFPSLADFKTWLAANYNRVSVQWVGFYKKSTGVPSITWPESVDAALCYGWIDGLRRKIDEERYAIRFTPRKPSSHWSDVNIRRVEELKKEGLMHPAGLAAYQNRKEERSRHASYEQKRVVLDAAYERQLKANPKAWDFFQSLPPSIQKNTIWWVMSAKKEETRVKRLEVLIQCSVEGKRIPPLKWSEKK